MSSALAISSANESRWTVTAGPMTGSVRVMSQAQFVIGRAPECDFIIINDPKCSRRQAEVRLGSRGCEINSLNDKNPVLVNGREITRAVLNEGDIVTLGETEVQFSMANDVPLRLMADPGLPMHAPPQSMAIPQGPRSSRPRATKPPANNKRFYIYGALALVVLYFIFGSPTKKKDDFGLRTEQQTAADIEEANKLREAQDSENLKRVDASLMGRQAQENYVRGFRDYRKGQFERAGESFQACLALDSGHVLCNRYLRLAQRKNNEMIQHYVLLGRKYREQNQYQSCRSAFRNVMVMVKDANNETYKLAKANYETCNAFIEGRF